jgi:hypothetical protein
MPSRPPWSPDLLGWPTSRLLWSDFPSPWVILPSRQLLCVGHFCRLDPPGPEQGALHPAGFIMTNMYLHAPTRSHPHRPHHPHPHRPHPPQVMSSLFDPAVLQFYDSQLSRHGVDLYLPHVTDRHVLTPISSCLDTTKSASTTHLSICLPALLCL